MGKGWMSDCARCSAFQLSSLVTFEHAEAMLCFGAVPTRGVLHTAGVVDDQLLFRLSAWRMEVVLTPKARAAAHVHHVDAPTSSEALVLYSSVSGTLGSLGQANYSAANAVLD